MTSFNVFHADREISRNISLVSHSASELMCLVIGYFNEMKFSKVATVDCEDMHDVFQLTNHITSAWQENEGVTAWGKATEKARSTSVGDLIIKQDGSAHIVADYDFIDTGYVVDGCELLPKQVAKTREEFRVLTAELKSYS